MTVKEIESIIFKTKVEANKFLEDNHLLYFKTAFDEKEKQWRVKRGFKSPKYEHYSLAKKILNFDQKESIKIAKELCYPKSVIEAIISTKDYETISRILIDARHGVFPKENSND